ncbi:MAG: hypothetical protein ACI80N_001540 [Gammaproteobacteria bacterium]|jgi:hypothetical protein
MNGTQLRKQDDNGAPSGPRRYARCALETTAALARACAPRRTYAGRAHALSLPDPGRCMGALATAGCSDDARQAENAAAPGTRPNVIVLPADNLAPGILGFDGNRDIRTPRLDRLGTQEVLRRRALTAMVGAPRPATWPQRYPVRSRITL